MEVQIRTLACVLSLGLIAPMSPATAKVAEPLEPEVMAHYERLPIAFEPAAQGGYIARGAGYALLLQAEGASLLLPYVDDSAPSDPERPVLRGSLLQTRLVDANPEPQLQGEQALPGANHYLVGAAESWRRDVQRFSQVRYRAVYPGIDLVYHGSQQQMEYDFVVAPGADPDRIAMRFEGAAPRLDEQGRLRLDVAGGELVQQPPYLYQDIDGRRVPVEGHYLLRDGAVAFAVGDYDASRPLVIDPLLAYKLYVPGVNVLQATSMAVDGNGAAYIAGYAPAMHWLTSLPLLGNLTGQIFTYDAFVAKLAPDGASLEYTSFIGGADDDGINAIAIGHGGEAVVAGYTYSNELPVESPVQANKAGYSDGFVARIGADGKSLIYSSYLGGSADDSIAGLALGPDEALFVTGYTRSENFPTVGPLGPASHAGTTDAFIAKIGSAGGSLLYSAYIGGNDEDLGQGIAVGADGSAYFMGSTESTDYPTSAGAFQPAISPYVNTSNGNLYYYSDVFLTKVNAAGDALEWSSLIGGTQREGGMAVALDADGSVVLTGYTQSSDFPLASPLYADLRGSVDVFVTRFAADGAALQWSTYLGGSSYEYPSALALDVDGNVYVTGYTASVNFPTRNALQPFNAGQQDLFLSKLAADGSALVWSTLLGAAENDAAKGLAVGADGSVYLSGTTTSSNFPVEAPAQGGSFGAGDTFASKLAPDAQALSYSTYLGETNVYLNFSLNGYQGTSPDDPSIALMLPLRGLIGCTIRSLPTDLIGDLSVLYPNRIPCGSLSPAP